MEKFSLFTSTVAGLPINNIDTDQIIPARFLKTTVKSGLGAHLFEDWRYRADGTPNPDFLLNRPETKQCRILLAGANFGCGSSREHAPWALLDYGFRAIIALSFADIFRNNAIKNGLLTIILEPTAHQRLVEQLERGSAPITIDLPHQALTLPSGEVVGFPMDPFSKSCLLNGADELGYLLGFMEQIDRYEQERGIS